MIRSATRRTVLQSIRGLAVAFLAGCSTVGGARRESSQVTLGSLYVNNEDITSHTVHLSLLKDGEEVYADEFLLNGTEHGAVDGTTIRPPSFEAMAAQWRAEITLVESGRGEAFDITAAAPHDGCLHYQIEIRPDRLSYGPDLQNTACPV